MSERDIPAEIAAPAPPTGMRVIEFVAENIKRLEVVHIRPDGDIVELTGKNGSGKTSVLDALFWTLAGSREIAAEPIRRGADEGFCQLDLGEFVVRRNIAKGESGVTTSLSVRAPNGAEYRRPQELLDRFFNSLSLDPLAFLRMSVKEQFALLRGFVPDVDFEAIELENNADFNARRDLNTQVRQLKGLIAKFVVPGEHELPEAPIDLGAMEQEFIAAGKLNTETETRRVRRENVETEIEVKLRRAEEMLAEAHALAKKASETGAAAELLRLDAEELRQKLHDAPPLPEIVDTSLILNKVNQARGINTRIDVVRQRREAEVEAKRLDGEAKALTDAMAARRHEADAKIAAAEMPIPGLTLTTEGGVRLNDLPFDQASDAEQLRTSIALAMALNPRLKVIRVRDGSLLDSDGMALVSEMARERGYQVWLERVGSDSPTGIELVAGRVRKREQVTPRAMSETAPRIDQPGIYQISDAAYLADPVVVPSLNNTTARLMLVSPRHAWAAHPRLGGAPDAEWDSTDAQDVGTVAHAMFLQGEDRVRVLNVSDFRTNKAKEMREAAIAEGKIPLKLTSYEGVRRVVDELERFRLRTGAFTAGKPEQTLIWTEGNEWGRCKVDWLPDEPGAYLWDLKTTSGLASADTFARSAYGYDMQASYYPRGAECVRGEPPEGMRFCVIETKPPYGIRVFEYTPAALDDANEEIHDAIALWQRCRETDEWPAYPDDVEWIDIPPWKLRERMWQRQSGRGRVRSEADAAAVKMMLDTGNLGG